MPTTTITRDTAMPAIVHKRSAYELWREAHPYEGRHRGRAAVEDDPRNVHVTSAEAAY